MIKSVFQKVFFTYLSILAVIMLVLSITITALANAYVFKQKRQLLDNVAYKTIVLANEYDEGAIGHAQLSEALDAMGYTTDTKIYIIRADASRLESIELGGAVVNDYLKDALAKALCGETVVSRRQYSSKFGEQVVFAAYPWQSGADIQGVILLLSPEETISAIVGNIRLIIGLSAALFVILGGVVIYFFARRFVRPIKAIDAASAQMARGEAVPDIDIRSRDELGALAKSFNSMKNKIRKNEQLRSELISNISHDLRTPITNINGFLSGMAEGVIQAQDYPKYIGILLEEVRLLIALTDDILQTAKLQSGRIELNASRFPLRSLVSSAASANNAAAQKKSIVFSMEIDESLMVNADRQKLEQVLINLIGNAVKYADENTTVCVRAVDAPDAVMVSVTDHGVIISEEDLPHVFDRFYRAASNATGGFGLGLCIVKTYIDAHGGGIFASSDAQNGTVFSFTIPHA